MTDEATRAQILAAEPGLSTWVAANAGSGKTRVLTDRVARLLLAGVPPERILCLTYTRAAAAEMQERLFKRLGRWTMLPDAALAGELAALSLRPLAFDPAALAAARRLFARALDAPGGLKIQTIHAFCDALLRRFPLEAGVSPGFRALDERSAAELQAEVLADLALASERGEDAAFDGIAALLTEDGLAGLVPDVLKEREAFPPNIGRDAMARILGVAPDLTEADLLAQVLDGRGPEALRRIAGRLEGTTQAGRKAAAVLRAVAAGPGTAAALDALEGGFLTQKGTPLKTGLPSADFRKADPAGAEEVEALKERVAEAAAARTALGALDRTLRLHRFARRFLDGVEARKAARGLVDFDDLVARARMLLTRSDMAAWALYKLDGGIDHILVDEAQDTSPAQWEVISALAEEFLSGEGARDLVRTLFVVGDLKQSIYSFQGADPAHFLDRQRHFGERLRALGREMHEGRLLHSFRSAPVILRLVDRVFAEGGALGLGGAGVEHIAWHSAMPGRVEVWPWLPVPEKEEAADWWKPLDQPLAGDPRLRLAEALAGEIARWLAEGRAIPGTGDAAPKRIRPGDVLILVQRRGLLARSLIRALKARGVPVAGEDRMEVGKELAVRDLLAMLRFLAVPEDDLSLAAALRSPLFGLSEDDLLALCAGREKLLWQMLRASPHEAAAEMLTDLRNNVDYLRPFELLDRILTRHGGRARLLARLGPEVEDAVDELLEQAIAQETAGLPGLTAFLSWMDRGKAEAKREQPPGADAIRVMTVHGAKGLEAPVVILPDTGHAGSRRGRPVVRLGGTAFWAGAADGAPERLKAVQEARKEAEREERRRLLYVALTRAQSLLLVAGAGSEKGYGTTWHAEVSAAISALDPAEEPAPEGVTEGPRLVLAEGWAEVRTTSAEAAPLARAEATLPGWLSSPPSLPPEPVRVLTPSGLGGPAALPGDAGEEPEVAMARGDVLHRLLERLPLLPEAERRTAAFAIAGPGKEALAEEAVAVLAMREAPVIFDPGALTEVALTARLAELGGMRIDGRIDRLVEEADGSLLVIDYKSNRVVPEGPEAVPDGLLRQMGAYQAALERIHPGRTVRTALLWTVHPSLMVLPRTLVLAALSRAETKS